MAGERIEFSAADLAATAAAFDPAVAKAPIVIGHPATDDPAQGWAGGLVANARGLFAKPDQVDPAFAEEVRAGRWGTVSAKFYRPTDPSNPKPGIWYLRHIGFLGAAAPGVKGLDAPAFADAAEGVCFQEGVPFADWSDLDNASLWRGLRDWFISKFGQAEADAVIPGFRVQSLEQDAAEVVTAVPAAQFAAPAISKPDLTTLEPTVTPEQKAALEAENATLRATLAKNQAAQTHAANVAFCEGVAGIRPAWMATTVAALDHFAAQPTAVEFGEGEARAPLLDAFKTMLLALPPAVEFGEVATAARAAAGSVDLNDGEAIATAATKYQAEAERSGQNMPYAHAVAQVARQR